MGYFQAVVGKNIFLDQFEDDQKKDISSSLLQYLCSKEVVCLYMDEPTSNLPAKEQGGLLTTDGYPDFEEPFMFERGVYFSVFFCVLLRIYQQISWRNRCWTR